MFSKMNNKIGNIHIGIRFVNCAIVYKCIYLLTFTIKSIVQGIVICICLIRLSNNTYGRFDILHSHRQLLFGIIDKIV